METKNQPPQPKFNPEVSFLENPKIFELQNLIDRIISGETKIEKKKKIIN